MQLYEPRCSYSKAGPLFCMSCLQLRRIQLFYTSSACYRWAESNKTKFNGPFFYKGKRNGTSTIKANVVLLSFLISFPSLFSPNGFPFIFFPFLFTVKAMRGSTLSRPFFWSFAYSHSVLHPLLIKFGKQKNTLPN